MVAAMATPTNAAAAPTTKHSWKAPWVGSSKEPIRVVELVSSAAITAAATLVPIERISPLIPTAEPASVIGTESRIRVGIAAYPIPTPADATHEATSSCHG